MKIEDLRGKKVVVFGLGVEGFSTAKFLEKSGIRFAIAEKKELRNLPTETREFIEGGRYQYLGGEAHAERLKDFDVIFRNPGIPLWNPRLEEAVKVGAEVTSQTKLFFDLCPGRIIGVTGTKGKGTTATLVYEMLKNSGQDVFLGGNIGQPPLDFVDNLKPSSWIVLELSSFQLEDLGRSPHIAVLLMTTQEHLSSQAPDSPNYHRSITAYLEAKRSLVRFQNEEDFAVVNADFSNCLSLVRDVKSRVVYFSTQKELSEGSFLRGANLVTRLNENCLRLGKIAEVFLRGVHNLQNVLAASTAALLAGAKLSDITSVIKSFRGLEHRLEFVREVKGVKFYNDSFSTTPETAIAAIKSFTEPLILILGGSEKGSDYTELGQVVVRSRNVKAIVLIGNTAEMIAAAINQAQSGFNPKLGLNPIMVRGLKNMQEIVQKCGTLSSRGDVVLLSPACASFDMFKNYKDRGEKFKNALNDL